MGGDVLINTPLLATRENVKPQIKVGKVVASSVLSIIPFSATRGKTWLLRSTKWLFPTCCCCLGLALLVSRSSPLARREHGDKGEKGVLEVLRE